jgi:hypothetical protein
MWNPLIETVHMNAVMVDGRSPSMILRVEEEVHCDDGHAGTEKKVNGQHKHVRRKQSTTK